MVRRHLVLSLFACMFLAYSCLFPPVSTAVAAEEENGNSTHEEAINLATEDAVLKEQIIKIDQATQDLHHQIVQVRQTIQQTTDQAEKAKLYAQLDDLQKDQHSLEQILHELLEEAKATEWTKIDAALKRAKRFERYQEEVYQKQEVIRDRQK